MRYYHMIIQRNGDWDGSTRREYISNRQGSAPDGWKCVVVCGYHDKPREVQKPCINCVYYAQCGSTTRTAPCDGRKTKSEVNSYEEI